MLRLFKRYKRDERGILVVDFMMTLPLMMLWMFASITVFDAFVKYNKMVKATATVANLISRLEITTNAELENIFWLYREIASVDSDESGMVITSVHQNGDDAEVHWAHEMGNATALEIGDPISDSVPELVNGDYIVMIETFRDYTPIIDWDFFPSTTFQVKQPFVLRFTGKLENTDIDTGLTEDNDDGSDESGTEPPGS